GGELFAIEQLAAPKSVDGATSNVGPLGRRWARSRLEEMLSGKHDVAQVTRLAMQFGLVSPYTSMVAIGDEVVVQGGTRRSVAVPVSVPAGMKWQAVKRETTVETTSKLEEQPRPEQTKRPAPKPSGAGEATRSPVVAEK